MGALIAAPQAPWLVCFSYISALRLIATPSQVANSQVIEGPKDAISPDRGAGLCPLH